MTKEKATSPEKKAALEMIQSEFKGNASRTQRARLLEAAALYMAALVGAGNGEV